MLVEGALYKTGICVPLLRCVSQSQGAELLKEVHDGHCGTHLASQGLAAKALRQGLYWPTMTADAKQAPGSPL